MPLRLADFFKILIYVFNLFMCMCATVCVCGVYTNGVGVCVGVKAGGGW